MRTFSPLPRKLDIYIMKKFMVTFFMALLMMIIILIIIDVSEKIDDFVTNEAPLKAIIFDYYLNFIPYFINMFSPLFVFVTVIFFTSKMAQKSEIVAILSCGISFHRMMVPYLISATIIGLLSLSLNLFVIPHANAERMVFQKKYLKDQKNQKTARNIHYQIAPGQFAFVESYSTWNNTAYQFTLESIEDNKLLSKLTAETATYDSLSGAWKLKKYVLRDYIDYDIQDRIRTGAKLDTVINLWPSDMYVSENKVETLSYNELNSYINTQKMRGDANVKQSLIEKHTRFALPFSAFILTIMGVSLSSKKRRGGIGWNLGIGIALAFTYILFLRFSQMFVYAGDVPPHIALWIPNLVFTLITIFLYRIAPK